jgi:hypothetical protein
LTDAFFFFEGFFLEENLLRGSAGRKGKRGEKRRKVKRDWGVKDAG